MTDGNENMKFPHKKQINRTVGYNCLHLGNLRAQGSLASDL